MILPKFAEWAWTVGPFLWGRSSVPRLEDFHTEALRLGPSLLLTPVQVAFGAGHGFVAEDQLDSVGVNAALCQRRSARAVAAHQSMLPDLPDLASLRLPFLLRLGRLVFSTE